MVNPPPPFPDIVSGGSFFETFFWIVSRERKTLILDDFIVLFDVLGMSKTLKNNLFLVCFCSFLVCFCSWPLVVFPLAALGRSWVPSACSWEPLWWVFGHSWGLLGALECPRGALGCLFRVLLVLLGALGCSRGGLWWFFGIPRGQNLDFGRRYFLIL